MNQKPLIGLLALFFVLIIAFYVREIKVILAEPVSAWSDNHSADCGVVLTGGPGRVREGFDLLVQKRIKKLIISGVYPGASLREIFPQFPYYSGIDKADVILEKRSGTTFGNAQQTLPLVEALSCKDIVLVTSRLHMYRSRKIFKKIYSEAIPIYTRGTIYGSFRPDNMDVFWESTKSLFYSLWAY